jgi:hypothetical protein
VFVSTAPITPSSTVTNTSDASPSATESHAREAK